MEAAVFDTLKYSKKMMDAGFQPKQAEAMVEMQHDLIESHLATKRDIAATKRDIAEVKRDIRESEQRIVIKLGGLIVAGVAVIAVLVEVL